ncbi:MAG: ATP synthase subunit B [Desulfobacterales bacterium SG8_35_2]|jgi:V/A-type H+-transporting ATPase subunit B|nr:MAG: ATP synthase subunit B [Desulfobacterales bacterium SG8_35_2]
MRLAEHKYRTTSGIAGQLLNVENVHAARIGEVVKVIGPHGDMIEGEILEIVNGNILIQLFGETRGLNTQNMEIVFTDVIRQVPLARDILGRRFNGSFEPLDGLPMFYASESRPARGYPINPVARLRPEEFIETGISTIDGLNTLVKGQKLPIFSCAGLPAKELVAQILQNARLRESSKKFAVIFVALGLTFHEYSFYLEALQNIESEFAAFINMADDPVMERLMAPRFALTVAEYLAFDHDMDILVLITDMTNYCDALREISNARKELPGRRGYPGYMYSDLASLYERAGRIRSSQGSITMIPVITMPEDDITHPIPDLTGYITEGQIVLSRELHQQGVFPPVDVLPSLSRLMQKGIGADRTREDHRDLANMLYKHYAKGRELKKLEAIVGRDGMAEADRLFLEFATVFENEFVYQGAEARSIYKTLDKGLEILERFDLLPDNLKKNDRNRTL